MKPRNKLAETTLSSGATMALYEHDGDYSINLRGQELMHSRASASELLLGEVGTEILDAGRPATILIGGLGLGFTLKSVLERTGAAAEIEVAEIAPQVVEWNRQFLRELNGQLLDDPRVRVASEDVTALVRRAAPESYDVILLDIDNGPVAMVAAKNATLYSKIGLRLLFRALKPGGRAVFWSAGPDMSFEKRLTKTPFVISKVPAKSHLGAKRAAYLLYVADRLGQDSEF